MSFLLWKYLTRPFDGTTPVHEVAPIVLARVEQIKSLFPKTTEAQSK
jgi:L-lactate utilization protein LutB